MVMENAVKPENVNGGTPLPQRAKNQQANKKPMSNQQQKDNDGAPAEKKPRFNQPNVGNQNQKGFGGNQKQGNFGGPNRGGPNRGGNQHNRGNVQNQQQNQQNQLQNKKQTQQNQQQNKPQSQQNQQPNKPNQQQGNSGNAIGNKPDAKLETQGQQQKSGTAPANNSSQQGVLASGQNQPQGGPRNQGMNPQQMGSQHSLNQQQRGGNRGNNQNQSGFGQQNKQGGGGFGGHGFGNRNRNDGNRGNNFGGNRSDDFHIIQRLRAISGPTHELPPMESNEESKFSGRNRLYVGNLTSNVTEEELREMFKPYGEIGEVFMNTEKNFAFLKMDYHANAEKAKRELDGSLRKGRNLRVRFAPNSTILRIKNLTPFVSNELLYKSFEVFGPIERAYVVVDDRGKSTSEGIVEYSKKSSANTCLRYCMEKCFFLTASLRPCVVEPFDVNDDNDGLPDKSLNKKMPEFNMERSVGPRFAELNSFEHEYGTRWKQLHELFKSKQEALKRELILEEEKLEAQMEYARYEHETELLRQELRKRESDNERKKMEWEMREKKAEEMRKREEENMRRAQNDMQSRMQRQEEEMRRRQQENTLFMQAQQLNSLLDQQEGGFGGNFDKFGSGGNNSPFPVFSGNSGGGNNVAGSGPANNLQDTFSFEFGGNQNQAGNQGNPRGNNGGNPNTNSNPWERRRRF